MFVYGIVPGAIQTTNATPLTANDCFFHKPGAGRSAALTALYVQGRGAGLTALSGLSFRLQRWFTTAASGGSAVTPAPRDIDAPAAKSTAAFAVGAVTSGTGGPTLCLSIGCGAAGPGGWIAPNVDAGHVLEAASNTSNDVFCASGTASLNFEMSAEITE
jgi:hypothetical protein